MSELRKICESEMKTEYDRINHLMADSVNLQEQAGIQKLLSKIEWSLQPQTDEEYVLGYAVANSISLATASFVLSWGFENHIWKDLALKGLSLFQPNKSKYSLACAGYNDFCKKLGTDKVHSMIQEAVQLEKEYAAQTVPISAQTPALQMVNLHIELVADQLLVALGYEKLYSITKPIIPMRNFFEEESIEYSNILTNVAERNVLTVKL